MILFRSCHETPLHNKWSYIARLILCLTQKNIIALRMDYIYGIGNEVLFLFAGITLFLAFLIYYILFKLRREEVVDSNEESTQFYNILPTYNRACPVCLGNPSFKVATNCGHAYCGTCMLELAQHSRPRISVHCAVCRSTVTWIIEQFTDEERENYSEEAQTVKASITQLKRYLSVYSRSFFDHLRDLPTLAYFMMDELMNLNGMLTIGSKLKLFFILLLVLIYVLIPYDLVPEIVFGYLGLLDDFLATIVLFIYACEMFRYFITERQN